MSPVALSSSYLFLEPIGTSTMTGKISGTPLPKSTSCHGCILPPYSSQAAYRLAPAQSSCTMPWRFFTADKDHVIQIFAVTRLQWFSFDKLKRSLSIGLPFGPQEYGVCHVLVKET